MARAPSDDPDTPAASVNANWDALVGSLSCFPQFAVSDTV